MPLQPGDSRAAISNNIHELTVNGSRPRSHAQIVAIALSNADRTKRADGGSATIDTALRIAHRASGGIGFSGSDIPSFERSEMRSVEQQPYGFSLGQGGGRTDKNNLNVAASSYVLPADVVAGLGDGNSLGGAHVWDQILSSMPWGIPIPRATGHHGLPTPPPNHFGEAPPSQHPPISPTMADGGEAPQVPIAAADGEIILHPNDVLKVGQFYSPQRDLDRYPASHDRMVRRGHRILDSWIKNERGKNIRKLKSLKGPVGSSEPHKGHT